MTPEEHLAYLLGLKKGVWLYAYWKDGEQYVGTAGRKLNDVLSDIDARIAKVLPSVDSERLAAIEQDSERAFSGKLG